MNDSAEKHEEMPDKVSAFLLQGEGNDPEGIDHASGQGAEEQGQIFLQHAGQKYQPAPAQNQVKRHVKRLQPSGAPDGHEGDAGDDDDPLGDAEEDAPLSPEEKKPEGGEGAVGTLGAL